MNPKRTVQQLRGSIGATAFELFVNRELHWIYRPVHQENDFGIDGYIDIVDDGEVTGAGLAVQIKCGETYIAKRTPGGGIRFDGEIKHLNYYSNLRQPVLLIVLNENGGDGHWVQFQLEKTLPSNSPDRWWIEIPDSNKLTSSVSGIWERIAGPIVDMTAAFEAEWANYRFNDICTELIVAIRKDDVLNCDTEPLFQWQSQLLKTRQMMLEKRASVEFWFEGWSDDPRELCEIPEIRNFYRKTLEDHFPWIYWLEPDRAWIGYSLLFNCGCDVTTSIVDNEIHAIASGREAIENWVNSNFHALNIFTDENNIEIEINKELSANLVRFLSTNAKRQ